MGSVRCHNRVPTLGRASTKHGEFDRQQVRGYTLEMEATVTKSVHEISADERRTLEGLLGLSLLPDQQVLVMVYDPDAVSDEIIRRRAAESIRQTWKRVDAHVAAEGISADEFDAAIDEAMQHVRRRTGECAPLSTPTFSFGQHGKTVPLEHFLIC